MQGFEKSIQVNRELVRLLDELMSSADWDESLLLRVTAKDFEALRSRANTLLEQSLELNEPGSGHAAKKAISDQKTLVYICMYQSEGANLRKWEEIFRALATNSIGRPAYRHEKEAIQSVRERGNIPQEGYVAVYVDPKDIMDLPRYVTHDRSGHELLTLKQEAVFAEQIAKFVHANQKTYTFNRGKLVLSETPNNMPE